MSGEVSLLVELGFHVPSLLAGLAGGIVNSFLFKQSTPIAIIGTCLVGALTANYTAPIVNGLVGTPVGFTAFAIGVGGMAVVQILYDKIIGTAKTLNPPAANPEPSHDAPR